MKASLRKALTAYFKEEFADLIKEKLTTGHKLSKFNVNPLVLVALSSGVYGDPSPSNMAKALLYPRVFGTSINTTFGEKMQGLCIQYLGARASSTSGMDIEYKDKLDGSDIIMQLKAGPNTINHDDVDPIITKMTTAYRLLRRNGTKKMPKFALGAAYGAMVDISGHYKKIASSSVGGQEGIPIFIGQDFWHRLTGDKNFYIDMISVFIDLFQHEDYSPILEEDVKNLAAEIEAQYFTRGKLNIRKF